MVWATDLKEEQSTEGGGKGSPDGAPYSYSVNFAVALSSRPVREIRRIWADGKLIRGASGDLKIRTKFRLLAGDEEQQVDPLIGSVETIAKTPAYRGIALAIFEEFQLSEFGNRIPALTFEIVADPGQVRVSQILFECSGGIIDADGSATVGGFAAYGSSLGDAIHPLVDTMQIGLAERDGKLRVPSSSEPTTISQGELGCSAEDEPPPMVEYRRDPATDLPSSRTLSYYDPGRDFQSGQMRASIGRQGRRDEQIELPAAVSASEAKQLVEQGLASRLAASDRVKIRLPPARMNLRPGEAIILPGSTRPLEIQSVIIDGFAVEVEARPTVKTVPAMPADSGRPVSEPDLIIGRTELAILELPALSEAPEPGPRLCLAGSNAGKWKPAPVEIRLGSEPLAPQILQRRAMAGCSVTILDPRVPPFFDELSTVEVRLFDPSGILLNADCNALLAGANLAMLGNELIQFGRADPISGGVFRLSKLLRGRRATEWAASTHSIGEPFLLIEPSTVRSIDLPASAVGALVQCTSHGIGDVAPLPQVHCTVNGEAMRPPSPCHLTIRLFGQQLQLNWVWRSYLSWEWTNGLEVPADGFPERYRLRLTGPGGQLVAECTSPNASFDIDQIPAESGETIRAAVATIGPSALSREARAELIL
jgi:hypothetical protein